jgi:Flp pilus assembly pilin Flp
MRLLRTEDGPTATEYAVLLALIAVSVIGAMSMFGEHMDNLYVIINTTLDVF